MYICCYLPLREWWPGSTRAQCTCFNGHREAVAYMQERDEADFRICFPTVID